MEPRRNEEQPRWRKLPRQPPPITQCVCWRNSNNEPLAWLMAHDKVAIKLRDGSEERSAAYSVEYLGNPSNVYMILDDVPPVPCAEVVDVTGELHPEYGPYLRLTDVLADIVEFLATPQQENEEVREFTVLLNEHQELFVGLARTHLGCISSPVLAEPDQGSPRPGSDDE